MISLPKQSKLVRYFSNYRYSFILILMIIYFIQMSIFYDSKMENIINLLIKIGLTVAMFQVGSKRRIYFYLGILITIAWFIVTPDFDFLIKNENLANIFSILFFIVIISVVTTHILNNNHINIKTLNAALIIYILIGSVFFHIYLLIYSQNHHSFVDNSIKYITASSFFYFSFQTITTLGSGDFLPITPVARIMTVLEAILGQFYIAIIIARTVSLLPQKALQADRTIEDHND